MVFCLGLFDQNGFKPGLEENGLFGVQAFAGGAKAPLLQAGDLKVQRLVFGLLELELRRQALDELTCILRR